MDHDIPSSNLNKIKVVKSTATRYDFRIGWEWATFIIGEDGSFFVNSSYGDYAYYWSNHGRPSFNHFLVEMEKDTSYLINKLAKGKKESFNLEETLNSIKQDIIQEREAGSIGAGTARNLYNIVKEELVNYDNLTIFVNELYNSDFSEFYQDYDDIPLRLEYEPQLTAFIELFWPSLVAELRKEIENEQR